MPTKKVPGSTLVPEYLSRYLYALTWYPVEPDGVAGTSPKVVQEYPSIYTNLIVVSEYPAEPDGVPGTSPKVVQEYPSKCPNLIVVSEYPAEPDCVLCCNPVAELHILRPNVKLGLVVPAKCIRS